MGNPIFDSAKLTETIAMQDMEYDKKEKRAYCRVTCPQCWDQVLVPFDRIVQCPACNDFFKVSLT
jgi:ribosomal protein S27E